MPHSFYKISGHFRETDKNITPIYIGVRDDYKFSVNVQHWFFYIFSAILFKITKNTKIILGHA